MTGAERPCLPRTLGQGLAPGFAVPKWLSSRKQGEEAGEAQEDLLGRTPQGPSGREELVPILGRLQNRESRDEQEVKASEPDKSI